MLPPSNNLNGTGTCTSIEELSPTLFLATMPKHKCPFPECTYETDDVEDELAAVLLTVHSNSPHLLITTSTQPTAKIERIRRPTLSSAGASDDWSYFPSLWNGYTTATKITGKDEVLQLLECCDEQLHKDLTRNAGGSLANKPLQEVMQAIKILAMQLHNMRKDDDDTIRSFSARARGQAGVCNQLP